MIHGEGSHPVDADGNALPDYMANFGSVDRANNDVCLNHLFTHFDCGATLGVAYTAQVCETGTRTDTDGNYQKAINVGYVGAPRGPFHSGEEGTQVRRGLFFVLTCAQY